MEKKYRLELIGITYNQIESGVYALILQQAGTSRRIPIVIGFPEAQAIECKLQEISTPRPLTHDTMVSALAAFGVSLVEVWIRRLPNGVFAADLVLFDGTQTKKVDSRSSDAVALAIRVGAPIYTSASVLQEAGFDFKEQANDTTGGKPQTSVSQNKDGKQQIEKMTDAQLVDAMSEAAEKEDYELAARLKCELDRRNRKNT